jgi:Arc/MetJ-type ribon-helix-helix transcriptional regulator
MPETLSPEVQKLVQEQVDGQRFTSANEVLLVAMRLFKEFQSRCREHLGRQIKEGFDQIERGEALELDEDGVNRFFDELLAEAEQELAAETAATK